MGDLHLEPAQMHLFHEARDQLLAAMAQPGDTGGGGPQLLPGARVVQLGDLGGYKHRPGSSECFRVAAEYLSGFRAPVGLITGNHDLEGDEFETDADNLAAWQRAFQQHHYWAADLGHALAVGLSTVRFRSNKFSVHEVFIDDEQLAWFESLLAAHPSRPVVVFSHAPPMGSGLKVVQSVHVKNRCAWLNHSEAPQRFLQLLEAHPNVRLWFSGHFHLSQNFSDSISVVGRCAFVQTGVIGECSRDGNRQSRLLRLDPQGYEVLTVDHCDAGHLRSDLRHAWSDPAPPAPIMPPDELLCDPTSGWLCSQLDCSLDDGEQAARLPRWFVVGPRTLLAAQDGLLVQYDGETMAAVGVVSTEAEGKQVSLVAADGGTPTAADGSDVAAVLLTDPVTQQVERVERNEWGGFYQIFQPNKWVLKKQAAAAAAAAEAAAAAAPAAAVQEVAA